VRDKNEPFQLSFNASLKVDFQGSRVTSDGGLIVVRELDERLGLGDLIAKHLSDARRGKNTQLPLADLFRQSIYSRMAGPEDVNDAERLSQDPAFHLIGSEKVWDRGVALTSRLQTFETEMLAEEENFAGLARINRELISKVFVKVTGKEVTFRFLVISGGAELTLGGVKRRLAQQKSKDLNFGGSRIDDL
jgi:predicted ribosome quality control (RQC) complex YloA/Tae2 family protein